ncbi:MAG: AI-2E family transporter, partial [Clostridiales bacterium]|nr:AI-2E family transporter [Clostridiales bacterium]
MEQKNKNLDTFLDDIKKTGMDLLRSQLIISVINFVILTAALSVFNIKYALLIAFGIAVIDILPFISSGIVMLPWAVYQMILGDFSLGLKLAVLYIIISV